MKDIIMCWILTFLIYGLIRLWTRNYMKKHNKKNEKSIESVEKGPSKTKEKINA